MNRAAHEAYLALLVHRAAVVIDRKQRALPVMTEHTTDLFGSYRRALETFEMYGQLDDVLPWDRWMTRRYVRKGLRDLIRMVEQHHPEPGP